MAIKTAKTGDSVPPRGIKSKIRWFVVSLMFVAILLNYADREIWILAEPAFAKSFGWYSGTGPLPGTAIGNIALILFIWSLAYAIFNFPGGWIVDKLGLRKSMATMFSIWSIFTALTAATFNFISMAIVRAIMGAGEGPVWPINSKITKNWSSLLDESKAFTFAGTGQAVGPVIGLSIGALIIDAYGWPAVFIIFGVIGIIVAAIWYVFIRDTPDKDSRVNQAERQYIEEGKGVRDAPENKPLSTKDNWAISLKVIFGTQAGLGTLLVFISFGYILFTFLYWLPPLMFSTFAHSVSKSGFYSAAIDLALIVGYIASGPFNDGLSRHFEKVTARRMGAIVPMVLMIVAVGLSYFTGTAHQLLPTAILLAIGAGLMNVTVGSWAVNAVDLAPSGTSATVYGVYNGALNLMGAFNAIILGYLFIHTTPVVGFVSSIFFMALFLGGYLFLIRKKTWDHAIKVGQELRERVAAHEN